MDDSPYPVVSDNPTQQAAYEKMRADGESHNMAEMLATRSLPGLKTDTNFMARRRRRQRLPRAYYEMAKKAGVNTEGRWFCGDVAKYPGDPEAWVEGRGDIKRICEKNNWRAEGEVECNAKPLDVPDGDGKYYVADDIVKREVSRLGKLDPGLVDTPQRRERTTEETRQRLTGTMND